MSMKLHITNGNTRYWVLHGKIKSENRRGNTRRHFEENKTTVAEKRIAREALMVSRAR